MAGKRLPKLGEWVRFYVHFGGCIKPVHGKVVNIEGIHVDIIYKTTVWTRFYVDLEILEPEQAMLCMLEDTD